MKLPKWYKGWLLANKSDVPENEPHHLFKAMKARTNLLKILNDKILFCLLDPNRVYRDCSNYLDDMFSNYKLFNRKRKPATATIERHVAFGIPGGMADLKCFTDWFLNQHQEEIQ